MEKWKLKNREIEREYESMLDFNIKLKKEDAENMRWTLTKHRTAVVMEDVQRQILYILDNFYAKNK